LVGLIADGVTTFSAKWYVLVVQGH